jgi:predicted sugar kinase
MSDGTPETYFLPGTSFRIRDEWRRPAAPVHRRVRVVSPGRLHFNVIDFSKMRPVLPGGGGLGISTTTAQNEVEVSIGGGEGPTVPTARHLLALFREIVGHSEDDVRVTVSERIRHVHSGYGSNVTLNTAVLAGLNALFGTPLSIPEMWDVLTQNFVENGDDRHVYWGLDTGVGEAAVLYGGLVWVDEHARYVGSATAHLWVVTATGILDRLAIPRLRDIGQSSTRGVGDEEELEVLKLCLEYQAEYGERLLHLFEHGMKPYLLRDDAVGLLSLGWEMNTVGNHRIQERIWRGDVLAGTADTVRDNGGLYCTMSSAGPSIFALAASEEIALRVRDALRERWGEYFTNFDVGRAGEKLRVYVED